MQAECAKGNPEFPGALGYPLMSERLASPYDNFARRWLALAERRREQFGRYLQTAGRWERYYTRGKKRDELRAEFRRYHPQPLGDEWAKLVEVSTA